ncbi:putative AAA family ATPase [Seiridium cardinale]|uniref:AAA family ATPase n=1 Tax=Seiridium cardinale TaxID=138064 RepID=A0ABR2XBM1_9PEZI
MAYRGNRRGGRGRGRGGAAVSRPEPRSVMNGDSQVHERSSRLDGFFYKVLEGALQLQGPADAQRLIEAICNRPDKSDCVERLASSSNGRRALHKSLTYDTSPQFINNWAAQLMEFLSDPALKRVCNGELLNQILWVVVEPPLFWNAILNHVKGNAINTKATEGFAWLLLQMVILPVAQSGPFRETAQSLLTDVFVEVSPSLSAKSIFQKTHSIVSQTSTNSNAIAAAELGPGGRHDNDFVNYHDISILPTRSELKSSERPYIRNAASIMDVDVAGRAHRHLENQYRLLREDMLEDTRDGVKHAGNNKKKSGRRSMLIEGLKLKGIDDDALENERPCSLVLECSTDILNMAKSTVDQRKKALKNMPAFLKHQSFGCIMVDNAPLACATLNRNEDRLALALPCLSLHISNSESLRQVLEALQPGAVDFLQVPTPLFAYEPILERLKSKVDVELGHEILAYSDTLLPSPFTMPHIVETLEQTGDRTDFEQLLGITKHLSLDKSQVDALLVALTHQVASIQGPPGTGKSFVGALLTYILLHHTDERILVLAYTNHALDQFLEDLMDIGISSDEIVRLGSKSTTRTAPLLLSNQTLSLKTRSRTRWDLINFERGNLRAAADQVERSFESYLQGFVTLKQVLSHIEFHEQDRHYYDAFLVPEAELGHTRVGKAGKRARDIDLLKTWIEGKSAGSLGPENSSLACQDIWQMSRSSRNGKMAQWKQEIHDDRVKALVDSLGEYNKLQKTLQSLQREKAEQILSSKRVVGCTTTAASKYAQEIQVSAPGIIIVEEAGEILESHILAAMGPSTKQLIQIGDHKQLRPKVKSYNLTVESGRGFDLNRSLFERLVLQGRAHCTLLNQHRMRPEISQLIRHNYPDLQDAKATQNRPHLRGLQGDVIFVNHNHAEAKHSLLIDKLDENATSSKQNGFEADMVLKFVRYLGQQGYGTGDLVILVPYSGQLALLRDQLNKDYDPVLSDLDSHDLVQAGIVPAASASVNKKPIKLSTIDNYQGEESDIVVVSLTRCNDAGDIGFMRAPERLNVLVSRARNALIMIGSAETFMKAKNGSEEWTRLIENLKTQNPEDFEMHCPDGGCAMPWAIATDLCPQKHKLSWECNRQKPACQECRAIDEERREKAKRAKQLEDARQAKQFAYARQLKALQDQISHQQLIAKDLQDDAIRESTLEQQRRDLARLKGESHKSYKPESAPKTTAPKTTTLRKECRTADPVLGRSQADDVGSSEDRVLASLFGNEGSGDADPAKSRTGISDVEDSSDEPSGVPFQKKDSAAGQDWDHQKMFENATNEALDSLMSMVGLDTVKQEFLRIKAKVDTVIRQGADLKDERFSAALLGNPGTGKTTVARLYAQFLSSVGAIPGDHFEETTGSRLANDGIPGCQALIDAILKKGGGVFFLDEAYQIVSGHSTGGKQVLDFLLAEIENLTGKVVFVFAGYRKQMEDFFAHNPGIPSRVPVSLDFQDYEDEELLRIFNHQLKKKYNGRMKIEKGPEGRYMRIVARRMGRGRGREGFGNAREVQNVLSRLLGQQANRLQKERRSGQAPDDMLLTKIDLIGPPPSKALESNKEWKDLQKMIGLKSVKQSVRVLVDRLQTNYNRELKEQPPIECSLNKCFLGNPGTGKTTVAKLYGAILVAVGLLSNGEVVIKNPADFVGGALGQSEKNAKAILESTKGKVLIIDEAYMLAGGGVADPYKTAVVDTIVAEVQSTANEDRCVLLLGYKEQMEDMFRNVNPGLSRRFPTASGFHFEDYDSGELGKILDLKLKKQALRAGEQAKKVVLEVLERERHKPNFGNAGAVDIILNDAKDRQQKRLSENPGTKGVDVLIAGDIDPDYDRGQRASTNIRKLFKDVVGCDKIVQLLEGYQQVALNMKDNGMDPRDGVPFSFLFCGPPGTGKTSTARRMGQVYYDMGFLGDASVVECSATDIIGQYLGQTGPKVQTKFDEALGKVLFIDEAYRLAEGHFAKEAMDEIVDCLTKERYQHKLVVILAGYDDDMNRLMAQNPGLTRRFPDTIPFSNLRPHHCRDLLVQCLRQKKLDTNQLEASDSFDLEALARFETLSKTHSWGNAGDVQTLAKNIFSSIMKSKNASKLVQENLVVDLMEKMIHERVTRGAAMTNASTLATPLPMLQQEAPGQALSQTSFSTETKVSTEKENSQAESDDQSDPAEKPRSQLASIRDAGVSDEVWAQLELDKAAEQQRRRDLDAARKKATDMEGKIREQTEMTNAQPEGDASHLDALRALEAMRVELNEALREQREREEREKKVQEIKKKLGKMGVCPAGYQWTEQSDGFRCTAGGHFLGNKELGLC